MSKHLIVRVVRDQEPPETRVFGQSPVWVGSNPRSGLLLAHPMVAAYQGTLSFTSSSVRYTDFDGETAAVVDGLRTCSGVPAVLRPDSLVQIGPFRLSAEVDADDGRMAPAEPQASDGESASDAFTLDEDVMGVIRAISSAARHMMAPTVDTLGTFINRAVSLADAIAGILLELRGRQVRLVASPFDVTPLRTSWDAREIADYLLDPTGSEDRFDELRVYLLHLARPHLMPPTARGQA